jgi:2-haloacid dehalogenase
MPLNRRNFLSLAVAGAAAATAADPAPARIKAIAFDALTVFDPAPAYGQAAKLFPEHGVELVQLWRTRQFEYCWLRTLNGRYADFRQVTEEALIYAVQALKLQLSAQQKSQLLEPWMQLRAHPDAAPALQAMRDAGLRLAFLSNMTGAMLEAATKNSALESLFEPPLSTDAVRAYKPDPRAYRMAIDAFGLKREEIAFAAFGGWDAAGAKAFGYTTFWVNRLNLPPEELGTPADGTGPLLGDLAAFVKTRA